MRYASPKAGQRSRTTCSPWFVLPQFPEQGLQPELAVLIHRRTHPSVDGWCPTPSPKVIENQKKRLTKTEHPQHGCVHDPTRSDRPESLGSWNTPDYP